MTALEFVAYKAIDNESFRAFGDIQSELPQSDTQGYG